MREVSILLVIAMLFSGCYSWTAIKPAELPKLNDASSSTSRGSGGQLTEVTAAKLETPDGRLVEVRGESGARISVRGQEPMSFSYPILSAVQDDNLIVQAGNRGKTTIPLQQIESVEVSQVDRTSAVLLFVTISLIVPCVMIVAAAAR
ncbi:MAG TPA: hypothetical protein VJ801_15045 [Polyangia bacterium]|jgi:hypothetical protein|nr:hypothetical protein [Polyangia bacterium]